MKLLILLFPVITFGAFNWDYAEKIVAERRCRDNFRDGTNENNACVLGVTAYGESRSWQGLNRTRNQSQRNCEGLCEGTGNQRTICNRGCSFGRTADQ